MSPEISIYIAVFASVALAVWAIGSIVLNWGSVEQRQIRKLSHGPRRVADRSAADRRAKPLGEAIPAGGSEIAKGNVGASAAADRGRLSQTRSAAVFYSLAEIALPVRVRRRGAAVLRLLAVVSWRCSPALSGSSPRASGLAAKPRFARNRSATACLTRWI